MMLGGVWLCDTKGCGCNVRNILSVVEHRGRYHKWSWSIVSCWPDVYHDGAKIKMSRGWI